MRTSLALTALLLAACGERTAPSPVAPTPPVAPAPSAAAPTAPAPEGEPPGGALGEIPKAPPEPEVRPGEPFRVRVPAAARPPARRLQASDVEDFVAVMRELGTPEGKRDGLGAVLRRRGIDPAWWSEMSARITTAAIGVIPSRDAPVPASWADDLAVVAPHRERIRAAIAD